MGFATRAATVLAAGALAMGLLVTNATAAELAPTDDDSEVVSDDLGTHDADLAVAPEDGVFGIAEACSGSGSFGGGFDTYLTSGWTGLTARSGPCTSADGNGQWTEGQQIKVGRETHGQSICRHRFGPASDVWFLTDRGWIWSGGTSDARWNKRC